jgi:hypothetical protein
VKKRESVKDWLRDVSGGEESEGVLNALGESGITPLTLDVPYAHVYGVATFYTMYRLEPGGMNTIRMCTNISCMLRGGYEAWRQLDEHAATI